MEKDFIDYYKVLGVDQNSNPEQIKKAYHELSRKYHPDINENVDISIIKKINQAYEILGNKEKKAIYDVEYAIYKAHEAAEEKLKREKQRKYYEENHSSSRNTSSNTSTTFSSGRNNSSKRKYKTKQGIIDQIKKDWYSIRKEEKKYPFKKRHKAVDKYVYEECYSDNSFGEEIIFNVKRGTIHIFGELFYQLSKLSYITKDTIPKYIIRNRVVIGTLTAAIILGNMVKKEDSPVIQPDLPPVIYVDETASDTSESIDVDESEKPTDDGTMYDDKNNQEYIVYRKYKIQYGDTLSELAQDANSKISEIQKYNDLSSTLIKEGETLLIPYHIKSGDLKYASCIVYYSEGMPLDELADEYQTTVTSIRNLNEEAIENGKVISTTLIVPTFATQEEIAAQKSAGTSKIKE